MTTMSKKTEKIKSKKNGKKKEKMDINRLACCTELKALQRVETCLEACFVLISNWSSRLAFRPASNFVSSWNFLVCCNFHNLEPNSMLVCEVDVFQHWNSAAEEGAWVGLKPDLEGGTGFNLLRVQFWIPRAKETCFKKVRKWTRLKSKLVPGGSSFGPFLIPSVWHIC